MSTSETNQESESGSADCFASSEWTFCTWEYVESEDHWSSECGEQTAFGDSPIEFGFRFCPYCGKQLQEL